MATNFVPKRLTKLFLVLFLATATFLAKATENEGTPTISFYLHDSTPKKCDSNDKVIPVTRIAGKEWDVPEYGTVYVTEDTITFKSDKNAYEVGRAKGMYVTAGSKGLDSRVSITIEFVKEVHSGSTIEIQGISKQFMPGKEVSVVGGTKDFRFARGYATFKKESSDIPNGYTIIRCDVTLQ